MVLLERLPLPSLQAYTSFSVVLLASSFFFAHKTVLEHLEDKKLNETSDGNYTENVIPNGTFKDEGYMVNMANALLEETWCVWVSNRWIPQHKKMSENQNDDHDDDVTAT